MKRCVLPLAAALVTFGLSRATSQEPLLVAQTNLPPAALTNTSALSPEANMFYDALAPYGRWFWLDLAGWVWNTSGMDNGSVLNTAPIRPRLNEANV